MFWAALSVPPVPSPMRGWLSADHQVGQTGKTVHPPHLCRSGHLRCHQHVAGIPRTPETIIAINKRNENAPSSMFATYGIVGDLYKVVPS